MSKFRQFKQQIPIKSNGKFNPKDIEWREGLLAQLAANTSRNYRTSLVLTSSHLQIVHMALCDRFRLRLSTVFTYICSLFCGRALSVQLSFFAFSCCDMKSWGIRGLTHFISSSHSAMLMSSFRKQGFQLKNRYEVEQRN